MCAYAEQYPEYNLAKHKGYPTKEHFAALAAHGPSPIHRMSFAPVRNSIRPTDVPATPPSKQTDDKPDNGVKDAVDLKNGVDPSEAPKKRRKNSSKTK